MKTETPLFSSLHRRRGLYMFSMILLLTFIESNFYLIVFFVVALFPPTPPSFFSLLLHDHSFTRVKTLFCFIYMYLCLLIVSRTFLTLPLLYFNTPVPLLLLPMIAPATACALLSCFLFPSPRLICMFVHVGSSPFPINRADVGSFSHLRPAFASLHHDYACTLLLLNSRFSALSFSSSPFISPQSYTFIPPSQITFIYGSSLSLSSKVSSSKSPGGLLLIATGFPPSY